ncbi:MAG: trypsin-like peptidase domain-containing protein [Actinomycetes bacterium]
MSSPAKTTRSRRLSAPDLIARVTPAVALVQVTTKGGGGTGSAFAVKMTAAQSKKAGGVLLATNAHVVDGEKPAVLVRFGGGYDCRAKIILIDKVSDVAFITVEEKPKARLAFRDMNTVRLGETAYALGNPYGFECSVSKGVVSGVERSVPHSSDGVKIWGDLVQTDAEVRQGNSGGPLIDDEGRILGMNTRGYKPTHGWSGFLNLAVSSRTISKHLREFLEFGDPVIKRSAIGARVGIHEFTPEEQRVWDRRAGAKLLRVTDPKGPAAKAGMKNGDVVIGFRGREVDHFHDLQILLDRWSIGEPCEVQYVRNGELCEAVIAPRLKR